MPCFYAAATIIRQPDSAALSILDKQGRAAFDRQRRSDRRIFGARLRCWSPSGPGRFTCSLPIPRRMHVSHRFIAFPEARCGHRDGAGALCAASRCPHLRRRTTSDGATVARATEDQEYALVQLKGEPLATYVKTKPAHGKKIDFNSNTVKSYRAQLSALRNDFKQWLRANAPEGKGHRRVRHLAQRGGGASSTARRWRQIAAAPQVAARAVPGAVLPERDRPRHGADQRAAGLGAGRAGRRPRAPASRSRSSTAASTSRIPASAMRAMPAQTQLGDTRLHQQQGHRRQGVQQQDAAASITRPRRSRTHGTHVAGTVACNYLTPAPVNGVTTYDMSGVAPRALLGNYNVFPGPRRERALRGHPQRARRRLRRRLRHREHEPGRRLARHPGPADDRRRQPRPGQHGRRGGGRQFRPGLVTIESPGIGGARADRRRAQPSGTSSAPRSLLADYLRRWRPENSPTSARSDGAARASSPGSIERDWARRLHAPLPAELVWPARSPSSRAAPAPSPSRSATRRLPERSRHWSQTTSTATRSRWPPTALPSQPTDPRVHGVAERWPGAQDAGWARRLRSARRSPISRRGNDDIMYSIRAARGRPTSTSGSSPMSLHPASTC